MRIYQKKLLHTTILAVFTVIILLTTSALATENINANGIQLTENQSTETQFTQSQSTEYNLEKIGMKISIPTNLTNLITALENNDERLGRYENKEEYLKTYRQSGIIADFVDRLEEQPNTEIIIAMRTSSSYASMQNFNTLSEDDMNEYTNRFVAAIKQQNEQQNEQQTEQQTKQKQQTENQANEQADKQTDGKENIKTQLTVDNGTLIKTNNGNCFIKITSTATQQDKKLNMHMYYTIMNGRLITISFRDYQGTNNEELENATIQNIQFYEVERPLYATASDEAKIAVGFATIMVIILLIIVFFIRRKDKKMFNKNIKDVTIKQYSKFGGLLVFFWTLCFYQILLRVIDISDASTLENLGFYKNAIIVQNTIVSLISMYQIYITVKRQQETPKKLVKSNIIMLITTSCITLSRIVHALIRPMEVYTNKYFEQEISALITNILYPFIWIMYFTLSKRVQTYYYLPKKTYKESIKQSKIYQFVSSKILKCRKGKTNERKNKKHN